MPINRPTLNALIERKKIDFANAIPGVDLSVASSFLGVLSQVLAGAEHSLYGYQDYIGQQIIPATATAENLEYHAYWLCGGMTRNPASVASGTVVLTGNYGAIVPAGSVLQRSDGVEYKMIGGVSLGVGNTLAGVTSLTTGQSANFAAGGMLSFVSPISGVNSAAVIDVDGITAGTDQETDNELLKRMGDYVAKTPNGGSVHDYKAWAKQVPGVTRVWVMPHWQGVGNVGVYFMRDNDPNAIPDAVELAAVQAKIDGLKPVKANVTVYQPLAAAQQMAIAISPDTPAVRAAIEAELKNLFTVKAQVEDGSGTGTILLSHIRAAISAAIGEVDNNVMLPAGNITVQPGEIAFLGTINWQSL